MVKNKPINPDEKKNTNKRDITEFLPSVLQTPVLKSFFSATINQLYQPQEVEEVVGYIGEVPSFFRKETDFYIDEITEERKTHQLTHAAAFTSANNVEFLQFYKNMIDYLKYNGADVRDHNRLFSEEFYSWAPPINMDAFINFRNYYWLPNSPEPIVINDPTNLDSLVGNQYATITVNGSPLELRSHMLINPKNDSNPANNDKLFIVEGVGRAIIFVEDEVGIAGWDIFSWDDDIWDNSIEISNVPDYFVMERGAKDKNAWSRKNRWFHKSEIKNFDDPSLVKIRATRPIIMFERDLKLWNHGTNFLGQVNLVSFCPELFSVLNNLSPTYGIPPFGGTGISCIDNDITYSETWTEAGKGISGIKVSDGFGGFVQISNNMLILFANSTTLGAKNRIYRVTGISDTNPVIQLEPVTGFPNEDDYVIFVDSFGIEHIFFFDGNEWKEGQTKTKINQPPLFQLYDIDLNKLDDETVYNLSNFRGSRIFGYAIDNTNTTTMDKELGIRPVFNENGRYVFENYLNSERWTYIDPITTETKEIPYYYFWRIESPFEHLHEYGNNWNLVKEKSKQYVIKKFMASSPTNVLDITVDFLTPIIDSTRYYTESVILKVNGKKKTYITDWIENIPNKQLVLNFTVEKGDFVEIRILPANIVKNENEIFENPASLVKNAENRDLVLASYDDLFLHFTENIRKQQNFTGSEFGINNYKDTPAERWKGERILQHSAPILKFALLSKDDTSFVDAIRYVEREFIRFKNKFLRKTNEFWQKNTISSTNPDDWVDAILKEINFGKNNDFPFSNSGVDLQPNDKISKFIPASPAFLGVTQLYKPEIYTDDKISSTPLIRQHDGSIITTFGDFRDNVLLRLEERIFDSAPSKFKNDYIPLLSVYDIREGRWRTTDYSREDLNRISERIYNRWLAENSIGSEDIPSGTDNFSINYNGTFDSSGNPLPGNWRGIYLYYYDTDRPDLFPWEMLGFSIKPSWWDFEYGPAPYTSGNSKLWNDLENGLIRQGPRQGIDPRFARPGLSNYIPVSPTGELLDPIAIGIPTTSIDPANATKPYVFGDMGLIEFAWTKSENYSFDLSLILFLTKPAQFVSFNWNTDDFTVVFNNRTDNTDKQFVFLSYKHRPENKNLIVHNESSDILNSLNIPVDTKLTKNVFNKLILNYGIQQWISDFLGKDLKNITENFGRKIRGIESRLSYRTGRFIDSSVLRVDSDSFGLVPRENVKVTLYAEKFIKEAIYSGVIIEKTSDGYTVNGYDFFNKVFYSFERNERGKSKIIGVGERKENIRRWVENTQYFVGEIVILTNSGQLFKAKETHISGNTFDPTKWISIKNIPSRFSLSAKVFSETTGKLLEIPYGTKFKTVQEVVNFLIGYQDYLKSIGFVFDVYDPDNNEIFDFVKSAKEFMLWILSGIEDGDVIALSPLAKEIKYNSSFGMISTVETSNKGFYSILNRYGKKIPVKDTAVIRNKDEVRILPVDDTNEDSLIYFTRLSQESIEHAIVLDNTTIFDNIINNGLFGVSLSRVRLSTIAAKIWKGKYEAAGFIITPENIIVPNYDKLAEQFRFIFDINDTTKTDPLWKKYSFHNIGYQERDYLSNLIISDKSQVGFYQGLLKTKGTRQSVDKILRSQFITNITKVELFEEWMIFGSEYGVVDDNRRILLELDSNLFNQDPQLIEFKIVETDSLVSASSTVPVSLNKDYFYNINEGKLYRKESNGLLTVLYNWQEVIDKIFIDSPFDKTINYRIGTIQDKIIFADSVINEKPSDIDIRYRKDDLVWKTHYGKVSFDLAFAGHVKNTEVSHQFFNKETLFLSANPKEISLGDRIWIYEVSDIKTSQYKDWSIFEVVKVNTPISSLSVIINPSDNNEMKISFVNDLGTSANPVLIEGDILLIKANDDIDFEGIYEIKRVENLKEYVVSAKEGFVETLDASAISTINSFEILNLVEVRFETIEDAENRLSTNYYLFKEQSYSNKLFFINDFRNKNEKFYKDKFYGIIKISSFEPLNAPGFKLTYSVERLESQTIDSRLFDPIIVRDIDTKSILGKIPVYDPLLKKLIPIFEVNIDFMTFNDPAKYTNGNEELFTIIDSPTDWTKNKVGKRWFNIRKAKFLDYKTTDIDYSRDNWGKLANKSIIEIAEWTESANPPSSYNGNGVPLYGENSPYVLLSTTENGIQTVKYYFWVTDTNNIPEGKTATVNELKNILKNPTESGFNWYSPLSFNSFLLSLSQSLRTDTFIELSWSERKSDDIPHKEWYIAKEGTSSWLPPDFLWNKMVDSLVGFDFENKPVPDPKLPKKSQSGISVRPRKTMFVNRKEAVRNLIFFLNNKFQKIRFLEEADFTKIFVEEPEPTNTDFVVENFVQRDSLATTNSINVGQTVLVRNESSLSDMWSVWELVSTSPISWKLLNIQKLRTSDFIETTDFFDEEIDPDFTPTKIFANELERDTAFNNGIIDLNEIIIVLDNGFGVWEWQQLIEKIPVPSWKTVAKQNSTIKLKDTFYVNNEIYGIFTNEDILLSVTDLKEKIDNRDGRLELREILKVIKNDNILGLVTINEIFFNQLRYILTEPENNSEWIVKLSTLVLGNIIEGATKETTLRPDLVKSMIEYLEEAKPYRSKFREITRTLLPESEKLILNVDDFDLQNSTVTSASFDNLRKFEITLRFDRVSCENEEIHPEKLIFTTNGTDNKFSLFASISGIPFVDINTFPVFTNYDPFKTGKEQLWTTNNIRRVIISKPDGTYTILNNSSIDVEVTAQSMVVTLPQIYPSNTTIIIERWITSFERMNLYYVNTSATIQGKPLVFPQPPMGSELISGCEFKGIIVEGGGFELSPEYFDAVKDNILIRIFNPFPNEDFYISNIAPLTTPEGEALEDFMNTRGPDWFESYVSSYGTFDPYINNWIEFYGFNQTPFSVSFSNENTFAISADTVDFLYDVKISGISTLVSGTTWLGVSSFPFSLIYEGGKFSQPTISQNHPEELTPIFATDLGIMRIYRTEPSGYPTISNLLFNYGRHELVSAQLTKIVLDEIPHNRDSLIIFNNGLLLEENIDYIFDYENLEITFVSSSNRIFDINQLDIRILEIGGDSKLLAEKHLYLSENPISASKISLDDILDIDISGKYFYATVDGYEAIVNVSGKEIEIQIPISVSANDSTVLSLYIFDGPEITKTRKEKISISATPFEFTVATSAFSKLPYLDNIILFSDGKMLCPPFIENFVTIEGETQYTGSVDVSAGIVDFRVYFNNMQLVEGTDYSKTIVFSPSLGFNVIQVNLASPLSANKTMKFVTLVSGKYDYDISDVSSKVTIINSFVSSITYFWWDNNSIMNTGFEHFDSITRNSDTLGTFVPHSHSLFISENGLLKVPTIDYITTPEIQGWDIVPWDSINWDEIFTNIEVAYKVPVKETCIFKIAGIERGNDNSFLKIIRGKGRENNINVSKHLVFTVEENITTSSTTILLRENTELHPAFRKRSRILSGNVQEGEPNVIWIGNERIEYFNAELDSTVSGSRIWKLETINRGTTRTPMGINEDKLSLSITLSGTTNTITISGLSLFTASAIDINARIITYQSANTIFIPNYPYNIVPTNEITLVAASSSTDLSSKPYSYFISADTVHFGINPPAAEAVIIDVSGTATTTFLPNVVIDIIFSNWKTNNVTHEKGELAIVPRTKRNERRFDYNK